MTLAHIALGSNQGDGRTLFELAIRRLERAGVQVVSASRVYRTRPVEGASGPSFLNMTVSTRSGYDPLDLLILCKGIERGLGRGRTPKDRRRPIDLDIVFFGGLRRASRTLCLPHPRWRNRDFILRAELDLLRSPGAGIPGLRASEIERALRSVESSIERTEDRL